MKAITIWQPWASLIACGAKKFETRSWATKYRGPIAIHAAKKDVYSIINKLPPDVAFYIPCVMKRVYKTDSKIQERLAGVQGCIIATAELTNCFHIVSNPDFGICASVESQDPYGLRYIIPSQREMLFGDWTPGRYAWQLANVKMLPEPIPAKGKQRLWECEVLK